MIREIILQAKAECDLLIAEDADKYSARLNALEKELLAKGVSSELTQEVRDAFDADDDITALLDKIEPIDSKTSDNSSFQDMDFPAYDKDISTSNSKDDEDDSPRTPPAVSPFLQLIGEIEKSKEDERDSLFLRLEKSSNEDLVHVTDRYPITHRMAMKILAKRFSAAEESCEKDGKADSKSPPANKTEVSAKANDMLKLMKENRFYAVATLLVLLCIIFVLFKGRQIASWFVSTVYNIVATKDWDSAWTLSVWVVGIGIVLSFYLWKRKKFELFPVWPLVTGIVLSVTLHLLMYFSEAPMTSNSTSQLAQQPVVAQQQGVLPFVTSQKKSSPTFAFDWNSIPIEVRAAIFDQTPAGAVAFYHWCDRKFGKEFVFYGKDQIKLANSHPVSVDQQILRDTQRKIISEWKQDVIINSDGSIANPNDSFRKIINLWQNQK